MSLSSTSGVSWGWRGPQRQTPTSPAVTVTLEGSGLWCLQGFTLTSTLIWPRCHHPGSLSAATVAGVMVTFMCQLELGHGAQLSGQTPV